MASRAAADGVRKLHREDDPSPAGARKRRPENRLVRSNHSDDSARKPEALLPPRGCEFQGSPVEKGLLRRKLNLERSRNRRIVRAIMKPAAVRVVRKLRCKVASLGLGGGRKP